MIVARAPLRISFGGGTDLPAYYERFGGLVVSAAITPACHVAIAERTGEEVVIHSRDYQLTIVLPTRRLIAIEEPLALPRAVLSWFAAQGLRPSGCRLTLRADVPPGSGLGSSSAMAAALVCAVARLVDLPLTPLQVAEIACEVEIDLLGHPIGRQDQYAAALGGINTFTFSQAGVNVTPLGLAPEIERSLQQHLLLVSTRKTRDSATLLRSQRAASGDDGDVSARLHRIKALAAAMREALLAGDLARFGALLDESWQLKRGLSQGVTSPQFDRWYELARRSGAFGGKIAGAGGGGFFLFCVPPARREQVTAALRAQGLTPFPMTFDRSGCQAHDARHATPPRPRPTMKGDSLETVPANQA